MFSSSRLWETWEKTELVLSGEVILDIKTGPDKLQETFIENFDSYFDAASREQLLCRKNINCFPKICHTDFTGPLCLAF